MTKTPYDQFSKEYLLELLSPLGQVEKSREVSGQQPATKPIGCGGGFQSL